MRLGVDLGGTKIEAIALGQGGSELARERIATPQGSYRATVKAVGQLIGDLVRDLDIADDNPVGVGIPGTVSPHTGLIKNANSVCLIGEALDKDLADMLKRPVRLSNDADCFTVSESTDGAGVNARIVFGVILGTGVGGGITFDSNLISGPNAIAGEWGHMPMPWPQQLAGGKDERPGPACYCGHHGCIETFLSGPGMEYDHELCTGHKLTTYEILSKAGNGDTACELTLQRYDHRLARGLANVINLIDPEIVVLGGGMSNLDRLYQNVAGLWDQWVFSDHCDTKLKKNVHGDSSGVRGAAWLWDND